VSDESHDTSVAVWDIPSPVVRDRPCCVKVGLACSGGCALNGYEITVHDTDGTLLSAARLSDTAWPGSDALYWAHVELPALGPEGRRNLQVRCNEDRHSVSAPFSFTIAGQPEHAVRIVAIDAASGAPIDRVELRLGAFRATTGDDGIATVAVPGGAYEVILWKVGYQASPVTIAVSEDVRVAVPMEVVRKAEQPYWM
jgi:hypothetical protein